MKTYISLLRGINVSGKNMIKMPVLQEIYLKLGFCNVKTYIQSGNVVFQSDDVDISTMEKCIHDEISKSLALTVHVFVIESRQFINYYTENPYLKQLNPAIDRLYMLFLSENPSVVLLEKINREVYLPDEFIVKDKVIYLHCPSSYGNTKLNNTFFEQRLKLKATARNLKTVQTLIEISENA